jgi:hypothetical protein
MIRVLPQEVAVSGWTIAFHRRAARRWVEWLAGGRYKHVSAFTYVSSLRLWVLYDVKLAGAPIVLLPDSQAAIARISAHLADADLITMPPRESGGLCMGFFCVPAIKHLVGLRGGALRPDALWRDCLRQGGNVVHGTVPTAADHRSADGIASAASQA